MSAEKARFIRKVWNDGGEVAVIVGPRNDQETLTLHELKRPELIRAAAHTGCHAEGGKWASVPNEDIIAKIRNRVLNEGGGLRHRPEDNRFDVPDGGGKPQEGGEGEENKHEQGEGAPGEAEGEQQKGEGEEQDGEAGDPEQGDGEPKDGEQGEAGDDADDEPFTPDPADVPSPDDSIEDQIEKLQRQKDKREEHERQVQVRKEQREKEAEAKREEERKREEEEAKKKGPQAPKGSHKVTQDVLDALDLGHNVYLVGPAGTGKSFITQQCAEILGVPYGAISCGPQTPESRLWGYMDANSNYVAPEFRQRFEFGGIFNMDEVDNGHTGINTTVNQALAGDGANFPDRWVTKHDTFRMCATANTFGSGATAEYMGRNPQDAAFLDRFTFIEVPIDARIERIMVLATGIDKDRATEWLKAINTVRKNADEARIKIVASPRAAQAGAALMHNKGWDMEKVLKARVFHGLSKDRTTRLMEGV